MNRPTPALAAVRDHSRSYRDFTYVYPCVSRRSGGLSLGVNLNPDKVCNFDCIYCEVDRRTPGRAARVEVDRMREELRALIQWVRAGQLNLDPRFQDASALTAEIRDIAFSGDGEPTMAPNFAACARAVAEVKQAEGLIRTKIVLITNAAGLDKADVREGLALLDANQGEIWGKLDAGTEAYYRTVDRSSIRFERLLANLLTTAQARPIVIQTLFLRVHGQVMPEPELKAYCERLKALVQRGGRIREVHAYTIARPTPEAYATRLEPEELERLARVVRDETGLPVRVFA